MSSSPLSEGDTPTFYSSPPAPRFVSGAVPPEGHRASPYGVVRGWGRAVASPHRWPLRTKIVVAMLALFTVVTMAIGAASVIALRNYLYAQMDQQLMSTLQRPPPLEPNCGNGDESYRGPGNEGLIAVQSIDSSAAQGCASDNDNQRSQLTFAQLSEIFAAGLREPTNVALPSLGEYRLVAAQATIRGTNTVVTVVVGLPTMPVERVLARMTTIVVLGVLGGLLVVLVAGTYIVRRSLRPLDRVAATATRVSHLPLDRGQVDLSERVPEEDTDPRTEVGQVGLALNEMLEHIDGALQARHRSEERVRQFVADASHELRTPLASIRGYAELTRREPEPVPASVTHAIGRIESEGVRMSSLVEDLLLLARLDAGRPLETETVDLSLLLVNAVSDAHAAAPEHVWELDLPDEPVEVPGDGSRLHQIVANLLANARTHTDPGTIVQTSLAREGDRVRITVHDDGPGVPTSLQANVFQRFARGDTSRNRAGGSTGLGLSIVAAVAQAHGGTVELRSQPGDTTFSVLLPAPA
ncbi:sensor histidine kinase [Lapillicoccus jejuensis]|uniref:histidine kinase n=1 Tax=Lapillicoccus jejuensis TaxID=402171 RepID=A0A542DY92_9MICO|nr:HAMP domain-containing sensor histidine kinase [Lapillicoccus jejuensis]TQJ08073.1 two-component system OmpR family sensor kinase [Lapillicoccus jejuensis]